jgi:hypothetical protein
VIAEPDVALTDWGLAVECAILARLISRTGTRDPALAHRVGARPWLVLFFASTALAALLGGAVHGLFPDPVSLGQRLLWPITLLAIGVTAWAAWATGGHLVFGLAAGRAITVLAGGAFVVYGMAVWRAGWPFVVAIADYLPAAVFLLGVFAWLYARTRNHGLLAGIGGLLLTFVAAGVQHEGIDLSRVHFDHNALYHVIQAIALFLIYRGAAAALVTGAGR